jgi:uncharacterized protein (TIGR04255 family)
MKMANQDIRGVYPEAPLALVALEVKFPSEASTKDFVTPSQKAFRDRLNLIGDWVIESLQHQEVQISLGPNPAQTVRSVNVPRILTRDRSVAVSFPPDAITIETTTYKGYAGFRQLVVAVLEATQELLAPDSVARMGLRYIDEIRVPDELGENSPRWSDWLDDSLLPPKLPPSVRWAPEASMWTAGAQYQMGHDKFLVIRYGPQVGPVVTPQLRRPKVPPPGPVFLVDFDSSWQPDILPSFDPKALIEICDLLHAPASATFESFITEKLRNVFRGKQ